MQDRKCWRPSSSDLHLQRHFVLIVVCSPWMNQRRILTEKTLRAWPKVSLGNWDPSCGSNTDLFCIESFKESENKVTFNLLSLLTMKNLLNIFRVMISLVNIIE